MEQTCVTVCRIVSGWPITAQAQRLDEGISVLLTGGCHTHVGAVSIAVPKQAVQTIALPGHKESFVTQPFADVLCRAVKVTVCVTGGIHYDGADAALIHEIQLACQELCRELCAALSLQA